MNNQVKLINADKVFRWAELCVIPVRAEDIRRAYELGLFDPDTPPVPTIKPGDTRDPEKILSGVLGEIDKLKLNDSNPKAFKRINDIINGEVVE